MIPVKVVVAAAMMVLTQAYLPGPVNPCLQSAIASAANPYALDSVCGSSEVVNGINYHCGHELEDAFGQFSNMCSEGGQTLVERAATFAPTISTVTGDSTVTTTGDETVVSVVYVTVEREVVVFETDSTTYSSTLAPSVESLDDCEPLPTSKPSNTSAVHKAVSVHLTEATTVNTNTSTILTTTFPMGSNGVPVLNTTVFATVSAPVTVHVTSAPSYNFSAAAQSVLSSVSAAQASIFSNATGHYLPTSTFMAAAVINPPAPAVMYGGMLMGAGAAVIALL